MDSREVKVRCTEEEERGDEWERRKGEMNRWDGKRRLIGEKEREDE
jgi:hypothetical protein